MASYSINPYTTFYAKPQRKTGKPPVEELWWKDLLRQSNLWPDDPEDFDAEAFHRYRPR